MSVRALRFLVDPVSVRLSRHELETILTAAEDHATALLKDSRKREQAERSAAASRIMEIAEELRAMIDQA